MFRISNGIWGFNGMKLLYEWIITVFLSAICGMIIGLPIILMYHNEPFIIALAKSGGAGMSIGVIARFVVTVIYKNMNRMPRISFVIVSIVIIVGTSFFSYLFGVQKFYQIVILVSGAESIGMLFTYLYFRYLQSLNRKLHVIQQKRLS